MIGLTAGLEIARKALSSYQLALSVYGNNIANVNTPGFSRKRPVFGEAEALDIPLGRIGLGVDTSLIRKKSPSFLGFAQKYSHRIRAQIWVPATAGFRLSKTTGIPTCRDFEDFCIEEQPKMA